MSIMRFIRTLSIGLCGLVFGILISVCALLLGTKSAVSQPSVVKSWLASSGIYKEIVSTLVPQSDQEAVSEGFPTDTFTHSLEAAFSPDFLQPQTEKIVDATYSWLNGTTSELKFSVPLPERREYFENALVAKIVATPSSLAACSNDVATPQTKSSLCTSNGAESLHLAREAAGQISSQMEIFKKPFTQDAIKQNPDTKTSLQKLPGMWRDTTFYVFVAFVGMLLTVGVIAAISTDRLRSFGRLARSTFFSTILSIFVLSLAVYVSNSMGELGASSGVPAPEFLIKLVSLATHDIAVSLLYFYVPLCLIALSVWILLRRQFHMKKVAEKQNELSTTSPTTTAHPSIISLTEEDTIKDDHPSQHIK